MENHVYKQIEITGSSTESSDDAIRKAIEKAGQSVKHMDWFDVIETRGYIEQSAVKYWQVTIKIGFRIED
jgi:flavin-binding protein dodecin